MPIFFILSGRVIPVSVLRSGNLRRLVSAMIRRPFRLLIPVISIAVLDYLFLHIKDVTTVYHVVAEPIWFLFDGAGLPKQITGVVWTLSHEYTGSNIIYVLTMVMLQFKNDLKARTIILVGCIAWFQLTHSWMTHFVAGLLIADWAQHGYFEQFRSWKYFPLVQILMFSFSIFVSFETPWFNVYRPLHDYIRSGQFLHGKMGVGNRFWEENIVVFFFSFVTMLCIETSTWLQKIFSNRFFLFLGHISFAMYLFHQYWMSLFALSFAKYIKEVITDKILAAVVSISVSTTLLCIISYFLTPIIDTPSIAFGQFIETLIVEPWSIKACKMFVVEKFQLCKAKIVMLKEQLQKGWLFAIRVKDMVSAIIPENGNVAYPKKNEYHKVYTP